jgi:hypothetical protein
MAPLILGSRKIKLPARSADTTGVIRFSEWQLALIFSCYSRFSLGKAEYLQATPMNQPPTFFMQHRILLTYPSIGICPDAHP